MPPPPRPPLPRLSDPHRWTLPGEAGRNDRPGWRQNGAPGPRRTLPPWYDPHARDCITDPRDREFRTAHTTGNTSLTADPNDSDDLTDDPEDTDEDETDKDKTGTR